MWARPSILWLTCLPLLAQTATERIQIPKTDQPPRLADFAHGTPRTAEVAVSVFRQMDPVDGAPVSQPTTAYLSYDDHNLYVGWVCTDDPDKVRARLARRKDIDSDDRVTINIDTFHDHKHAYFFDVNPYSVQMDGIATDGQEDDLSFETLWFSEAQLTETGYVVLETIPFRSLRFPNAPKQLWGVALARIIKRNNEFSLWPYISHGKGEYVGQFGDMEIGEDISPGRNLQVTPYGLFYGSRFLDPQSGFQSRTEKRGGLDARVVLKDAFTLDMAVNPDFSQVESDEPQVTVNQRYEVYFPERRPFFMEKASMFRTPEQLFFSRRIADPQFGGRLTGTVGRWNLGVVVADDRAPGTELPAGDSMYGNRALDGVFRVEREFGKQSHVGVLVTSYNFGSSFNQVASADTRTRLGGNWVLIAQATGSETKVRGVSRVTGSAYKASIQNYGKHLGFSSTYTDRSPDFRAALGYIPRVDIREWRASTNYRWKPEKGSVVSFGPGLSGSVNWDRKNRLQDWGVTGSFEIGFHRNTWAGVNRTESYELFRNLAFRKHSSEWWISSEWYRWLGFSGAYGWGTSVNYYPGSGLAPFLARSSSGSAGFTVRPTPRLRVEEAYRYSRLGSLYRQQAIFNNHILRTKANYQFTRELSLRAIFDYSGVLPNREFVSLENSRRVGVDVLLTYLLHPGTAVYAGYSTSRENLSFDLLRSPALQRTQFPDLTTGRQLFIKLSYTFRY